MAREIYHEAPEFLDPRIMIVPEEEINHLLVALLRDVEWISWRAVIVLEGQDVDANTSLSSIGGISSIATG